MVNIKAVRLSNAELKLKSQGFTALFVGATRGIGQSTLIELAKNAIAPNVYIVGRSLSSTAPLLDSLKSINPQGTFTFIQGQASLLKDVDTVCAEIRSKEKSLDLLFISAGALSLAGRQESPEGLDIPFSLSYYSRIRFMYNLLPLLSKSASPRIVSVLAAGKESKVNLEDLELRDHYSLANESAHAATMMSLVMDELAQTNPSISFVHIFPGLVKTDLLSKMFGSMMGFWVVLGYLATWILVPVIRLISTSLEEAGERGLFVATNKRYDATSPTGNFFRLDWDCENAKDVPIFDQYKIEGTEKTVWKHTTDVFDRISARE